MTLGDLVKEYRERQNISMEEFSKICNLSKGYISMLENNTNPRNNKPIAPTLPTIKKIALAMNMDMDTILRTLDSEQEINLNFESERSTGNEEALKDSKIYDLVENYFGETTRNALEIYIQLDPNDQGEIRGEMKQMLKADKYFIRKESKHA